MVRPLRQRMQAAGVRPQDIRSLEDLRRLNGDQLLEITGIGARELRRCEELLDVTRERNPPHYHVALFPDRYLAYIQPMLARDSALAVVTEQVRLGIQRLQIAPDGDRFGDCCAVVQRQRRQVRHPDPLAVLRRAVFAGDWSVGTPFAPPPGLQEPLAAWLTPVP